MRNERRPIVFSKHARERMVLRDIIESEVETIVRTGAWKTDGIDEWLAFGKIDGRPISVAFVAFPDRLLVKTVMD